MKNIRTETIRNETVLNEPSEGIQSKKIIRNEYQPLAVIDRAIIELLISKLINNTYK